MVLITAEDTGETAQTYDDLGNLLTLTDPEGNTTLWIYDALYRVIEEENELADSRTFEYDAASRLIKKTDRNGRIVEYAYDNRNRLTTETWKNGSTTVRTLTFGYNLAGALISASDPAAAFTYTVDGLGQVREEIQDPASLSANLKLTRTLDAEGRQTQLQSYIGTTADLKNTYTYDFLSRMTGVTQQGTSGGNSVAPKRVDFDYNLLGQFETIERFADVSGMSTVATTSFTYDGLNRLLSLTHEDPASATLAGYDFDYDAASRITEITSYLDGLTTYSYDTTNQLTAADHTGQSDESYSFDLNGNRDMSGYDIGANNQLLSDGTHDYEYDDEGNRTAKETISSGAREEYEWDHRNRLVKVTFKNGSGTVVKTVDKTYDVFDRWIRRQVDPDGTTGSATVVDTIFVYDGVQILFEFDGSAGLTHRYLWGAAVDQLLADENSSGVLWPLGDHLGTLRDLAVYNSGTSTTSVANHRRYEAFGTLVSETNSAIDEIFGYTGRAFDEAIGLQDNWHRPYDPRTGQFPTEDPIEILAGDPNFRRYAYNSPTNLVDPDGLTAEGHHWTPLKIISTLFKQNVLSEEEYHYLAGRYSGPLSAGSLNEGFSTEHRCYGPAVEKELRDWVKGGRSVKIKDVVSNIKAGKSFDGKKVIAEIRIFNQDIGKHTLDPTVDSVKDVNKIRSRGIASLKARKYLVFLGALAGTAKVTERLSQADQVATILTEGRAMCRAMEAAREGKGAEVELALIGTGGVEPSVYDELSIVDYAFAIVFRKAVEGTFPDK